LFYGYSFVFIIFVQNVFAHLEVHIPGQGDYASRNRDLPFPLVVHDLVTAGSIGPRPLQTSHQFAQRVEVRGVVDETSPLVDLQACEVHRGHSSSNGVRAFDDHMRDSLLIEHLRGSES
jgi:hypothetical protein